MARRSKKSNQLETLTRQIEGARGEIGRAAVTLRGRLDLPTRIRQSVRRNPARWFGAAAVAGLLGSLSIRRLRRRPHHIETRAAPASRSKVVGIAAATFTLVRPLLQKWLLHQMRSRW